MSEELLQIYQHIPPASREQLYHYAIHLMQINNVHIPAIKQKSIRRPGIIKDPNYYMAPDFDEPMEDFREYMQ